MNLEDLQQIKYELKRFSDTVDEAIIAAKQEKGYTHADGVTYGKNTISGTRISGAVKRRALDLRYYLIKKL